VVEFHESDSREAAMAFLIAEASGNKPGFVSPVDAAAVTDSCRTWGCSSACTTFQVSILENSDLYLLFGKIYLYLLFLHPKP
jgi:hypothetical protein